MQTQYTDGSPAQDAKRTKPIIIHNQNETILKLSPNFIPGLVHIHALEDLLDSTERLDRLHLILENMFVGYLLENTGVWPHEKDDLEDFQALLQFLSACYRMPTELEAERLGVSM